jgi:hypothetical protein
MDRPPGKRNAKRMIVAKNEPPYNLGIATIARTSFP